MAITRHKHVNEMGAVHVFEVDSDAGTVSMVKPDGLLQPSSTNIEPILALPLADEQPAAVVAEPVAAVEEEPAGFEPVVVEPVEEAPQADASKKGKRKDQAE
jgi:hypothetical protein